MRNPVGQILENHYATLQVSPTASERVIQAAYRCLVQIHHPDKNAGCPVASEMSARINKAYSVLSDTARRSAYDGEIRLSKQAHERRSPHADAANTFSPLKSSPDVVRPFGFRPM
jgi:curved DNA-binding protein CbpA